MENCFNVITGDDLPDPTSSTPAALGLNAHQYAISGSNGMKIGDLFSGYRLLF